MSAAPAPAKMGRYESPAFVMIRRHLKGSNYQ